MEQWHSPDLWLATVTWLLITRRLWDSAGVFAPCRLSSFPISQWSCWGQLMADLSCQEVWDLISHPTNLSGQGQYKTTTTHILLPLPFIQIVYLLWINYSSVTPVECMLRGILSTSSQVTRSIPNSSFGIDIYYFLGSMWHFGLSLIYLHPTFLPWNSKQYIKGPNIVFHSHTDQPQTCFASAQLLPPRSSCHAFKLLKEQCLSVGVMANLKVSIFSLLCASFTVFIIFYG